MMQSSCRFLRRSKALLNCFSKSIKQQQQQRSDGEHSDDASGSTINTPRRCRVRQILVLTTFPSNKTNNDNDSYSFKRAKFTLDITARIAAPPVGATSSASSTTTTTIAPPTPPPLPPDANELAVSEVFVVAALCRCVVVTAFGYCHRRVSIRSLSIDLRFFFLKKIQSTKSNRVPKIARIDATVSQVRAEAEQARNVAKPDEPLVRPSCLLRLSVLFFVLLYCCEIYYIVVKRC